MPELGLHEDLSREDEVVGSSDRSFGLTFAVIGALIGGIKIWHGAWGPATGFLAGAAVFAALALLRPQMLAPLNRLWLKLSLLMFKVVNPVVMALLFFSTIMPIGLIMRACGKDMLRLRRNPAAASYWLPREASGAVPESMRRQF